MSKKSQEKRKNSKPAPTVKDKKKLRIALIGFIFIISISSVVFIFMKDEDGSKTEKKDIPPRQLARDYDKYAGELLEPIKVEMAKPVSPYKFVLNSIEEIEALLWKALDNDTTLATAWEKLGYINAQFHGKQALLRYESYKNQGKEDKMAEEEQNAIVYFAKSELYYDKALEFNHPVPSEIYYQKAEAEAVKYNYQQASIYLIDAIQIMPQRKKYHARLVEVYLYNGSFDLAVSRMETYREQFPDSEFPSRNLGSYYLFQGDTLKAVGYYEEAIELGTKPEVGKWLHKYYTDRGNKEKADYYLKKAYEAEVNYDPNKF